MSPVSVGTPCRALADDESIHLFSDHDLDMLLDRSPEAFARTAGWHSSSREGKAAGQGATFSVFTRGADEANDQLANLQDDDDLQDDADAIEE